MTEPPTEDLVNDIVLFINHYSYRFQVHKRHVSQRVLDYLKGLLQASRRNIEKIAEAVLNVDKRALQQFCPTHPEILKVLWVKWPMT